MDFPGFGAGRTRLSAHIPDQLRFSLWIIECHGDVIVASEGHKQASMLFLPLIQVDPIYIAFLLQKSVYDFLQREITKSV